MSDATKIFDTIVIKMTDSLRQQNVNKIAFSKNRRFQILPDDIQAQSLQRAQLQLEQMELINYQTEEFEKLNILCQYHKLKPVDESVYLKLTGNTAWEIIDFNLNQIYRNQVVFKLGNYSVEEYETYSPWDLFSRPQSVLINLIEITENLKTAKNIINLESIKPYIIEEALTEEKAQFKMTHQFVCPLFDEKTQTNQAFISAFKIDPLSKNERVIVFN